MRKIIGFVSGLLLSITASACLDYSGSYASQRASDGFWTQLDIIQKGCESITFTEREMGKEPMSTITLPLDGVFRSYPEDSAEKAAGFDPQGYLIFQNRNLDDKSLLKDVFRLRENGTLVVWTTWSDDTNPSFGYASVWQRLPTNP